MQKFKKLKNPEKSSLFYKTLVISINCGNCGSTCKGIFKKEESIEILKIFGFINNIQLF